MHFLAFLFAALLACVLAKDNKTSELKCHSIHKGSLKLATYKHENFSFVGNVNTNASAIGFGANTSLLTKADKPLHAEIFKCNDYPHTKEDDGHKVQLRADGKCATIVHAGFGVEIGVQFESCAKNLSDSREQWFGAQQLKDDDPVQVVPISIKERGSGILSFGIVSSYFDALAFSFNGIQNDNATELNLVLDTK